jgi:hypothetical protein
VVQLLFADLDLATFPTPIPANLPLFVNIGLTDSDFGAKPALAAWDALFARAKVAGDAGRRERARASRHPMPAESIDDA